MKNELRIFAREKTRAAFHGGKIYDDIMMVRYLPIYVLFLLPFATCRLQAKDVDEYFPTGMSWKEVCADPMLPLNTVDADVWEIGTDTLISSLVYKKVKVNDVEQRLWVREQKNKVWILTDEYPSEFLLYDFNWDDEPSFLTEYIRDSEDGAGMKLYSSVISSDYHTTYVGTFLYQYHHEDSGVVIRGIGRVSELNRNSCLLGYKLPDVILPGYVFSKVLWVQRNGKRIFYSPTSTEWIEDFPADTSPYDLDGDGLLTLNDITMLINVYLECEPWSQSTKPTGDVIIQNTNHHVKLCYSCNTLRKSSKFAPINSSEVA